MRFKLALLASVVCLTLNSGAPRALAQETLAGVGAASAVGASVGAAAAGGVSASRVTRGVGADGQITEGGDPNFPNPGAVSSTTTTTTTVTRTTPSVPLAGISGGGNAIIGQLLAPRFNPIPQQPRRSPRAQATYSRRVSKMTPKARKRLVLQKYRVPPRGFLAAYLPQDRYKFAKVWKYVSTESDRFYYRPQDMARRGFNPNRVIGFRTWQDALLAGYRPDPITKPEPGAQIAYLASMTRDQPLITYVEYVYAGQVSPAALASTYNYVRQVKAVIDRNRQARPYQRETVNAILTASLTGDLNNIPAYFGGPVRVTVAATDVGGGGARTGP